MKNTIKKGLSLGLGLTVITKEQAEKFAEELMEKGKMSKSESQEFVRDLMQKGAEAQKQLDEKFSSKMAQFKSELNVATKEEVEQLKQRIEQLEFQINKMNNDI
ncbi:phasin family protein [Pseudogracilibacillus auburnensis]|uniref:phasin family protein n=1 Tax=Pseudogracilibacillus auburnensis TaxID=1494959 RepID=UPI001A96B2E1|nr:polyhydroxyalkanoate synthesis regulator [Pseudogracilibacillus auburnensis]MBO1004010.1 polyhydroxyalkanoate synthesis regulator [Pseudogracilibacillus auburnensis]